MKMKMKWRRQIPRYKKKSEKETQKLRGKEKKVFGHNPLSN